MKRILFFAIFLYDFFSDIDEDRGTIQIAHSICQGIINEANKDDSYSSKMDAIASIPSLLLEFKGIIENVVYAEIDPQWCKDFLKLGISFDENRLRFNDCVIVNKISKIIENYKETITIDDLQEWKNKLLEAYKYMEPVCEQIENIFGTKIEAKKRQMEREEKAKEQYRQIAAIRKEVRRITIDCIDRDDSYSSKMEAIEYIPSLLLKLSDVADGGVICANIDKKWCKDFWELGIYIGYPNNKDKSYFILSDQVSDRVIAETIQNIIETYEETITIYDLQEWKDKLLKAYKSMKPVCKQIENIFGTKIEEKKRHIEKAVCAAYKGLLEGNIYCIYDLLVQLQSWEDIGVDLRGQTDDKCKELSIIKYDSWKNCYYLDDYLLLNKLDDVLKYKFCQLGINNADLEKYKEVLQKIDSESWNSRYQQIINTIKGMVENYMSQAIIKYAKFEEIRKRAKNIINRINGDSDCSSKMKAIASIPSLLLEFNDITENVVYEEIDQQWCEDFLELGIYFEKNKLRFEYQVIVTKINDIIKTYEKSITIDDLQEWKNKLLEAYKYMEPICERIKNILKEISNIFDTSIIAKAQQMKEEEKAKEQYRKIAAIQAKAKNIINRVNGDSDCSSKMKAIASIPSLLLEFNDITDKGVIYAEIKKEWREYFWELGIYNSEFNMDKWKLGFNYRVIVGKINEIIKSITIDDLQEWKNKLLEAYKCIEPECTEMEDVFDKEIEKRETENKELINHIAEKENAMVNYLVKKENELKIRKAQEALINFNPISVVQLSFEPKYTQSIIVNPIKTLRNCYMQANSLKNMINRQFYAETPIKRILFLQDLVKLMKGSMVGNYKLNCDLGLLKNLIFGDNYYSKQHLLEEDVFKDMAIVQFNNCMAKNIKIEELPLLIRKLDELGQLLSFGDFVVSVDSLHDLIEELQNFYNSFTIRQKRLARKSEKHKRKLEAKEKKEKRTTIYKDAVLKNDRKKAEKGYLKMISKESIMGTEKLFIPPIFADDDFVEEERLKLEEEKLEKIAKERIKAQEELNCKIKESDDDKKLVVAEDKIKRLNVTKNRTMKVRQQSTERKVPNRGNDVIESKKVSNRKFVAQTTNIKTNSSSNVLNKGNVIKDSKNNLRYIGMRSTNVDGKIILPEEYIKLPLSVQKEYTVYEE